MSNNISSNIEYVQQEGTVQVDISDGFNSDFESSWWHPISITHSGGGYYVQTLYGNRKMSEVRTHHWHIMYYYYFDENYPDMIFRLPYGCRRPTN
ncbi:MAG: hypothetical protein R2764_12995 [Bacteroidales bacterium]